VDFLDDLAVMYGGYVTEKEIFGPDNLTTGASSDLSKATELAQNMVRYYGMSDRMAPRTYGKKDDMVFLGKEIHYERDYSEKTAEEVDKEIERIQSSAIEVAKKMVVEKRPLMEKVVEALLEKETLEKEEFEEIVGPGVKAEGHNDTHPTKS
jgi:cell division protease FtsH